MLASQFDGESGKSDSYFFNTGIGYDSSGFHLGLTYSKKDHFNDDYNTGNNLVYGGSVTYTFENYLYLAAAYQNLDYEFYNAKDRKGHTLDLGFAYPINESFKFKTGYFNFNDGIEDNTSQDYQGANITFEWLPADGLRYDLSKKWEFD